MILTRVILLSFLTIFTSPAMAGNISTDHKTDAHPIFNKNNIFLKLPLIFKDYNNLLKSTPSADYIYPGSFYIGRDNKVYIQYVFNPKVTNNIIVVYSNKGVYEGYYIIDNGGAGVAGEGLVVTKNADNVMTLYAGSTAGTMKSYNLEHVKYGDTLESNSDRHLGLYNQFTSYNNTWLIESISRVGKVVSRTNLTYLDGGFNKIKSIKLDIDDSGYITDKTTSDAKDYNKRQGIALCGDFLVAGYGAYYSKVVQGTTNTYQGIKIFDLNGNVLSKYMYNPEKLISSFSTIGLNANRVENEGVACSENGRNIYSIYIYSDRKHKSVASKEGIAIFKSDMSDLH